MKFFGSITKLEADISATEAALQPVLEKAEIKTAMRDGKVIPIADATNAEKVIALVAAQPPGTQLEERSHLIQSNGIIAARLETTQTDLALSQTSVGNLTREKATLEGQLTVAQSSVQTLTNERADLTNRLNVSNQQVTAQQTQLREQKAAIARKCITCGCIALIDDNGQPLAKDATDEQKMSAAMRVSDGKEAFSFNDLLKSYSGAVNAAIAKTGAVPFDMPASPPAGAKAELKGRARMLAAMKIEGVNATMTATQ